MLNLMLLHGCRNFPLDFVPLQKKLSCFQTISFCVAMLKLTLFIVFYKMWNNQNQPENHQEPTKNQSEPTWAPPEFRNFGWFLLGSWSVIGGFLFGSWWVLVSSIRFTLHHLRFIPNQAQNSFITNRDSSYHWK